MSILTQKTISKKISIEGIGVHTGIRAKLDILPAQPNTGILFKRVDLIKNNIILPDIHLENFFQTLNQLYKYRTHSLHKNLFL